MLNRWVTVLSGVGFLGMVPAPALAEWVLVGENPQGDRYFVSEESVTELSEGVVIFDTLVELANPAEDGTAATIDRFVANCQTDSVANVSWMALDANQRPITSQSLPRLETNNAPSGSLIAAEIEFACTSGN
jgi:hypothetical protein